MRLAVSRMTKVICRGTWVIGIACRSHLCRSTPFGSFKHLFHSRVVIATVCIGKLNFHFKPVAKNSANEEVEGIYPRDFSNYNCSNNHANHSQRQSMTPRKLQDLHRGVQSMLKFVNGRYLHDNQQFCLIKYRIAQILLKINT